jgi:glycosyltransferase involved in cell wall biosynthesis
VVLPIGDVDGLTAALERLATDDDARAAMAEAAWRRGQSLPTWRDTAREFFDALRAVSR